MKNTKKNKKGKGFSYNIPPFPISQISIIDYSINKCGLNKPNSYNISFRIEHG